MLRPDVSLHPAEWEHPGEASQTLRDAAADRQPEETVKREFYYLCLAETTHQSLSRRTENVVLCTPAH